MGRTKLVLFVIIMLVMTGTICCATTINSDNDQKNKLNSIDDHLIFKSEKSKIITELNSDGPISVRTAVNKIGHRQWEIQVIAKNTLNEEIKIWVGNPPAIFQIRYMTSDNPSDSFLVYLSLLHWPGVAPLLPSSLEAQKEYVWDYWVFTGLSNVVLGFNETTIDKYLHFHPDFPILSEGDYYVQGKLTGYMYNDEWYTLDSEPVIIHLDERDNIARTSITPLQRLMSILFKKLPIKLPNIFNIQ